MMKMMLCGMMTAAPISTTVTTTIATIATIATMTAVSNNSSSHDVRFLPVVDSVMVDGRTIDILCVGDYEQAKRRLFQYAQSTPANSACAQGEKINGEQSNRLVAGRGTRAAVTGQRGYDVASPFGGDTLDAGNGVTDYVGADFADVGVA